MTFSPFGLEIIPMKKHFLINFKKDHDEIYHSLEPQLFDDPTSGREIDVKIVEKNPRPIRPFTLLAPVGSSSENPTSLPVYLMNSFDFVRRSMTEVRISIDGRQHKPDTFPFPVNGSWNSRPTLTAKRNWTFG